MTEHFDVDFYGKGNPVMEAAFASCVSWAWDNPEIRESFEGEAEMKVATNPMEMMIDESTGYDQIVAEQFIMWVAENVWGKEEDGENEG